MCDADCGATQLWEVEYRKGIGTVPAPLRVASDPDGNIIVAGQTGPGPTYLGGKLLNTGWPRGFGTAFVAKYDGRGTHQWSRILFDPTAGERKRGVRSGVKEIALGKNGTIHVLASRVGGNAAGSYWMTLLADGQKTTEQRVSKGLPVLMEFAERGETVSALGVREAGKARADLIEYRFEASGSFGKHIRGGVKLPEGLITSQRAHWSPSGIVWTAGLKKGGGNEQGGTLTCPIHTTVRSEDRSLTRVSSSPENKSCSWGWNELLVAHYTSGTPEWLRRFIVPGYHQGSDAAYLDARGNVYVVGGFTGAAVFGESALCALTLPEGYTEDFIGGADSDAPCDCLRDYADVFLVKVAATGHVAWARRIGQHMQDQAGPVAISDNGVVVAAVGSTPLPDFSVPRGKPPDPRWSLHAYGPHGKHLWTHSLPGFAPPLIAIRKDGVAIVIERVDDDAGLRLTALDASHQ